VPALRLQLALVALNQMTRLANVQSAEPKKEHRKTDGGEDERRMGRQDGKGERRGRESRESVRAVLLLLQQAMIIQNG